VSKESLKSPQDKFLQRSLEPAPPALTAVQSLPSLQPGSTANCCAVLDLTAKDAKSAKEMQAIETADERK
jgi:hypothetical protein